MFPFVLLRLGLRWRRLTPAKTRVGALFACNHVGSSLSHEQTLGLCGFTEDSGDDDFYPGGDPQVTNIMAAVDLGVRLDLQYVSRSLWNVEYQPKVCSPSLCGCSSLCTQCFYPQRCSQKNPAIVLNVRRPRATISIHGSGKLTSIGTRSAADTEQAMRKAARQIRDIGIDPATDTPEQVEAKTLARAHRASAIVFRDFTITNMSGRADYGHKVRLEAFAHAFDDQCSYEPEISPSAEFTMTDPPVNLRIFVSGKILIPKARSKAEMDLGIKTLFELLDGYQLS
jgi:transcription initiation factor TFIID TATA-box-binding protein